MSAAVALFLSLIASAADRSHPADAQKRYQEDRALCMSGRSNPKSDREDCERRMRGEGTTTGSVEGGGIYRELRTLVPAPEK